MKKENINKFEIWIHVYQFCCSSVRKQTKLKFMDEFISKIQDLLLIEILYVSALQTKEQAEKLERCGSQADIDATLL